MNLCVKCRYIDNPNAIVETTALCRHPSNVSEVTGRSKDILCVVMRATDRPCAGGALFEPSEIPSERTGPAMR